jgi:WG repeat protein
VRRGLRYGYIDPSGALVIPDRFDGGEPFRGGLARVRVEGREGYVDAAGDLVWEPTS